MIILNLTQFLIDKTQYALNVTIQMNLSDFARFANMQRRRVAKSKSLRNGIFDFHILIQQRQILITANCHQTWNKNPTPNPLIACGEGARM
ncbi:hypothetical protein OA07_07570 [Aphanizomenon flos-aquae 2012/KM1/D3]|nr:hypothetical protein OA07_20330 [Aphanizomenon flos-aquae 2012/KM1/D3]KHG42038.1 hypothetical protein OA07_07570 [Aphanizomenon flos-aquae 2012/KM1/D3]